MKRRNFALRYRADANRFYKIKKAKTNNVVTIPALAHKLARTYFLISKKHKPLGVTNCFA